MRHTLNVVLFLSLPVCQHAGVADHPDVAGAQRLFESWIRGQMAYRQLPGIAVGVVYDQELVWAKGFGYADVESRTPVTPATKFRMASHSKLFTATAIMQLRDAGKLRLDDPVSKYLPWFKIQPAEPDDPPVTIEELLTHSAGLPREAGSHWITYDFPTEEQVRRMDERLADTGAQTPHCFGLDAQHFPAELLHSISIQSRSGQTHTREISHPRGHALKPLTDAEMDLKFDNLVALRGSEDAAICHALRDQLWKIETVPNIAPLLEPLGALHVE